MDAPSNIPEKPVFDWRLKLGVGLLALSIVAPLLGVPAVATLGLSAAMTASISGALIAAGEVIGVAAVAVMGKNGYLYIKSFVLEFLAQHAPARKVSRLRYRIGLAMFGVPIVFGWLSPYAADLLPGLLSDPLPYAVGGDLLILASLFVLGGDFWDKLRSLFIADAQVQFPPRHAGGGS